jgi:uncharacterized membrane protein YeaQ/YmgE (transglycosylase-associated protein family)
MELFVLAGIGAGLGWAVSLFIPQKEGGIAWPHIAVGAVGALLAGVVIPAVVNTNAVPSGSTDAPNVLLGLAGAATLLAVYRLMLRLGRRDD